MSRRQKVYINKQISKRFVYKSTLMMFKAVSFLDMLYILSTKNSRTQQCSFLCYFKEIFIFWPALKVVIENSPKSAQVLRVWPCRDWLTRGSMVVFDAR